MNKRGAEKIISVYWFVILIIVAGAVIYMVSLVYGQPFDVRETEAEILANNAAGCISEGGYLKDNVLLSSSFKENFLQKCGLDFESPDFPESKGEYYAEISVYDFDAGNKLDAGALAGNSNLKQYCELKGKTSPTCLKKVFYAIDKQQKSYKIEIISVINKVDKNVQ